MCRQSWTVDCNKARRKEEKPSLFAAHIRKVKPGSTPTAGGDKSKRWPLASMHSYVLKYFFKLPEKRHLSHYHTVQIRYTRFKHATDMTSYRLNCPRNATVVFIFLCTNRIFCMLRPGLFESISEKAQTAAKSKWADLLDSWPHCRAVIGAQSKGESNTEKMHEQRGQCVFAGG